MNIIKKENLKNMRTKELRAKLHKIKQSIDRVNKMHSEAKQTRDNLFSELLSELDQEHDRLVALVRSAQYELLFDELLLLRSQEEGGGDTTNE